MMRRKKSSPAKGNSFFSLSKKSQWNFFDRFTAGHFNFIKMLLCPKNLDSQGFSSRAIG